MSVTSLPIAEIDRIKALNEYYILDQVQYSEFINIAEIAASICSTNPELIAIADLERNWLNSYKNNIDIDTIKNISSYIKSPNIVEIIPNISELKDRLNLPTINNKELKFYAQIPICTSNNFLLGILCIFDFEPKNLNDQQIKNLSFLTNQIAENIELKKKVADLKYKQLEQKSAYADLEKFSYVASHDLRSPLNNIISLTQLLKDEYGTQLDEDGNDYIKYLNNAAIQLADLVEGVLEYSKSSQILGDQKEDINIPELITEVIALLHVPNNVTFNYNKETFIVNSSRIALKQILLNLCDNAIRHNDKTVGKIEIKYIKGKTHYTFEIKDNGPGIAERDQLRIFELFERVKGKNKEMDGIGIGLAIVKKLIENIGGNIKVQSEIGIGTSFIFYIPI